MGQGRDGVHSALTAPAPAAFSLRRLDMTRLNSLSNELVREGAELKTVSAPCSTAIAIAAADKGALQLRDAASGNLKIVMHRGSRTVPRNLLNKSKVTSPPAPR